MSKKINSLVEEGISLRNQGKFDQAIKKFKDAIDIVRAKIKDTQDKVSETDRIKDEIDSVYSEQIQEVLNEAENLINKAEFDKARETYNRAMKIAGTIESRKLKEEEQSNIRKLIELVDLKIIIREGKSLRVQKQFDQAFEALSNALDKSKQYFQVEPEDEEITKIKKEINQTYKEQIETDITDISQIETEGNNEEAIQKYEVCLGTAEKMFDLSDKKIEIAKIKKLIYNLYSKEIKPILEKAKQLSEQNNIEDAIKELKNGLAIASKMYDSEQKELEIQEIGKNINPIYLDKIKIVLEEGLKLTQQEKYEESVLIVNNAVKEFKKAQDIAKSMVESEEKASEMKKIIDLINQTCSAGINIRKQRGVELIDQFKLEEAISELYSALSISKNIIFEDGEDFETKGIKDLINKVYIAEIYDVVSEGKQQAEELKYDEALSTLNEALKMTNKMYLSEEMNEQVKRIESLIRQAEMKKYIADGNLLVKQKEFSEEIQNLQNALEEALQIQDEDLRYKKINEVKALINNVRAEEIKLMIEQGEQFADKDSFDESYEQFEQGTKTTELIEENEELRVILITKINEAYVRALIAQAQVNLKNSNFDGTINASQKALKFDENLTDCYYYMAKAYSFKDDYDKAIENYNIVLNKEPDRADILNNVGILYEKKKDYQNAGKYYFDAVSIKNDFDAAWYNLANIQLMNNDLTSAKGNYERTIQLKPQNANAWLYLGHIQFQFKEYDNAINSFEKATQYSTVFENELKNEIENFKNIKQSIQNKVSELFSNRKIEL